MKKSNIEKIVKHVEGTMALEDMHLTNEEKQRLKDIHSGKTTIEEEIKKLNKEYESRN